MPPLLAAAIALAAFLLFLVQPMVGKLLLPWFGGSPGVWTSCMLFFQSALLAGYGYGHWLAGQALRTQRWGHALVALLSLTLLPIAPDPSWRSAAGDAPALHILALLASSVGLPFVFLAATSPLLQAWHARAGGRTPYRLYALSNAGSLLALLSYPFAFEPRLDLGLQLKLWSLAFAVAVALTVAVAATLSEAPAPSTSDPADPEGDAPPKLWDRLLWLGLSACASTLLLAVTSELTLNVAAVPFLWVLPLAIYLLSFILCFESDRWYSRRWGLRGLTLAVGAISLKLSIERSFGILAETALLCACLFVFCMVCHGELASRRPHPRRLTSFYLAVATGGALGGVYVSLLAPRVHTDILELPIAIAATVLLVLATARRDPTSPLAQVDSTRFRVVFAALALTLAAGVALSASRGVAGYRVALRNFYGTLKVRDVTAPDSGARRRELVHGMITHGFQRLAAGRELEATSYYGPDSGAGLAFRHHGSGAPRRIGVVGLGIGTLLGYGQGGDHFRLYEINPQVVDVARSEFAFLDGTAASTEIVVADGRLALESEASQQFDLLVIDVFSSDAIPVHILTREAFEIYFRHLAAGGLLVMNVSNRYLHLAPVCIAIARSLGAEALYLPDRGDAAAGFSPSEWMLIAPDAKALDVAAFRERAFTPRIEASVWTDARNNLLEVLR